MRILNVCSRNEFGGSNQRAVDAMFEYEKRGHECQTIFLYEKSGTYTQGNVKTLAKTKPGLKDHIKLYYNLYRFARKFKPDAVFLYSRMLAPLIMFLLSVQNRIVIQSLLPKDYVKSGGSIIFNRYIDLLWGIFGIYTKVILVSRTNLEEYSRYPKAYKKRIVIIENGVKFCTTHKTVEDSRKSFNIPIDKKVIGYVGRFKNVKNVDVLIDSLQYLQDDYHLVLAGEGDDESSLRRLAQNYSNRVHFLGGIAHDNIPVFMRSLDVFVTATSMESFGLVILEAAYSKIPIVATQIPSFDSILKDSYFKIKDITPINLAKTIRDVSSIHVEEAYQYASSYSFDKMVKGYLGLINEQTKRM